MVFDKTFQERLQEYDDIFGHLHLPSISLLKQALSAYLELEIDHSGWQAIWKIPRVTCETLKLPFPTIALVYVDNVNYSKQVAEVTVLSKQDHIDLPDIHIVPLSQLWLTKEQDKSVGLSLHSTGNALDVLHFFYTNLYMPWDDEDEASWMEIHLEQRLRLFYDMRNGIIPKNIVERAKSLLTQAKQLHIKCQVLQKELNTQDVCFEQECDEKFEELIELQVRLMEIQKEIELLENPLSRSVLIKRQEKLLQRKVKKNAERVSWVVFHKSDGWVSFFQQLKMLYPNEVFKTAVCLAAALDGGDEGDVIVVNKGLHEIKGSGLLETGGTLKGVYSKEETIITSANENIMFDLSGSVCLENLVVDASSSQCAVLVRSGIVTLKNCSIIGDGLSTTHQGFIVLSGASLELIDCCISGFGTAIVGNSKSNIKIRNCEIYDVNYGFKIHDDCIAEILNSTFHNCKEFAILVETDRVFYTNNSKEKFGDFSILRK